MIQIFKDGCCWLRNRFAKNAKKEIDGSTGLG